MQFASSDSVLFVLGLAAGPVIFLLLLFGANRLLAPRSPGGMKNTAFECGIPQAGSPWRPVNLRFSTVALLFVIFDAETVLLFAVAPAVKGSVIGAIEVGSFVLFLAFGLYYAWRKGALRWPS
ncbi:MAG: NADH-quinone oxidoreductase subunit A [Coriobacteriia bacterium]|nr:NADH-quinone oxidoreductase subunit A [Coriobacteriia bacterium]